MDAGYSQTDVRQMAELLTGLAVDPDKGSVLKSRRADPGGGGDGAWINPAGLAARINWAMDVPVQILPDLPDPQTLAANALGPRASKNLIWAATRAETLREVVGLVLASAEFNRR